MITIVVRNLRKAMYGASGALVATTRAARRGSDRACGTAAIAGSLAAIVMAATAAPASADAAAAPTHRTGTTAGGVPFSLHGRSVKLTVPASTKRGRRIEVRCGRQSTADLLRSGAGFREGAEATGSAVFRQRRRMTIRLNRDVSAIAEWCEFQVQNGRRGAAALLPALAAPPAPLVPGPGVREGITQEDGGRFLVDGSTVTLLADKALPGDIVLFFACYAASDGGETLRIIGTRSLAIGHGRRRVTADLGADVESAPVCFAENSTAGGRDLYLTEFPAAPAPAR